MNELAAHEYAALRATIRSRGHVRVLAFLGGLIAWAVLTVVVITWLPVPVAAVVPLLVLLGTFEVVRSLHLAVERIGRYIQVYYEDAGGEPTPAGLPAWERTAMALGPSLPGAGGHPLFLPVFLLAIATNFLTVLLPEPVAVEVTTLAVPHVACMVWMIHCDRAMRRQRREELARFRDVKGSAR